MNKLVATGTLITYVIILFGYGVATAGHELLHDIKNPFHTHGQVHEQGHGHEDENSHHDHEDIQNKEEHHTDNDHDHAKTTAAKSHDIEDHTNGFDKLNGQDQDVAPTETLSPLFVFVYTQSNSIIEGITSNFKLSETEHYYLTLYKSLRTEPITPPPSGQC